MQKDYPIGEAARRAGLTIEALRHYHRIGLLSPCRIDPLSGYRYYSEEDIAKLSVIQYLRSIELSLPEIRLLLSGRGIAETLKALQLAKKKTEAQIKRLDSIQKQLDMILSNYGSKSQADRGAAGSEAVIRTVPEQMIFLVPELDTPSLSNLQRFPELVEHSISAEDRAGFQFENAAGMLYRGDAGCLFATCVRCKRHPNVYRLPAGAYLTGFCPREQIRQYIEKLRLLPAAQTWERQRLLVLNLVFTGLIQWDYQVMLYLGV